MNEQIVRIFSAHPGRFISGEELSRTLQCSRTAIWKHIQSLRGQGYEFEAIPRRGYRLTKKPSRLEVTTLLAQSTATVMGRTIHRFDQVTSTQTIAHELAENGAEEGTLVIAEQQTAGRGTMGKKWHSPSGKGIWMSIVLRPRISLQFTPQLTLLIAVALCRSLNKKTHVNAGIKWPNDLLVDGKKISGILLESSAEDERLRNVIAGVGISVNLKQDDYPQELLSKATSLYLETGIEWNREELVCDFLHEFEHLYELFHEQGFAPIRLLWEALSVSLHRPIRVQTAKGCVEGMAEMIDEFGALVVKQADGQAIKVYSGDVEMQM